MGNSGPAAPSSDFSMNRIAAELQIYLMVIRASNPMAWDAHWACMFPIRRCCGLKKSNVADGVRHHTASGCREILAVLCRQCLARPWLTLQEASALRL